MIEKPKIQYIGQFYVHGSAAPQLEPKRKFRKAKTTLPLSRPETTQVRYIEPMVIISFVLVAVLLATMVFGMLSLEQAWEDYERMSERYATLNRRNFQLRCDFRASYDLELVKSKALGMGMVPLDAVPTMAVRVTVPQLVEEVQTPWHQEMIQFWKGLWA